METTVDSTIQDYLKKRGREINGQDDLPIFVTMKNELDTNISASELVVVLRELGWRPAKSFNLRDDLAGSRWCPPELQKHSNFPEPEQLQERAVELNHDFLALMQDNGIEHVLEAKLFAEVYKGESFSFENSGRSILVFADELKSTCEALQERIDAVFTTTTTTPIGELRSALRKLERRARSVKRDHERMSIFYDAQNHQFAL